jgi:hypothetical protein
MQISPDGKSIIPHFRTLSMATAEIDRGELPTPDGQDVLDIVLLMCYNTHTRRCDG